MGEVILFLFACIFWIGMIVFFCKISKSRKIMGEKIEEHKKHIALYIAENGFHVSREVSASHKIHGNAMCNLYVDYINKKWLLTSIYCPQIGKIRDFNELLDYAFFDEEGVDIAGQIARASISTALAIGSVGIGMAAGQAGAFIGGKATGLATGVATSIFANKAAKSPSGLLSLAGLSGRTKAYGIILKTTDCTDSNPAHVYDYCTILREGIRLSGGSKGSELFLEKMMKLNEATGNLLGGDTARNGHYKHNVALIQEMFSIFDDIIRSNS